MKFRIKVEVVGNYFTRSYISFPIKNITVIFYTLNQKNYIEAVQPVTDEQLIINKSSNESICSYMSEQKKIMLSLLKSIESIGSFFIRIQKTNYDEMEVGWIPETKEDEAILSMLPTEKLGIERDNSIIEISNKDIERIITLCSQITEGLFAFEFLRLGNVSFFNGRFYVAFINFFMMLEEVFGKGEFHTKKLEKNFKESDVLSLCILTAIDMFREPLDIFYVEWMEKEILRRDMKWDISGIISCIVRFRGDYFHSRMRTKVLEQRDQFFKYMAGFIQRICIAYCCYLIESTNMTDSEMDKYVDTEIKRLKVQLQIS